LQNYSNARGATLSRISQRTFAASMEAARDRQVRSRCDSREAAPAEPAARIQASAENRRTGEIEVVAVGVEHDLLFAVDEARFSGRVARTIVGGRMVYEHV
jgi:hypothetical protein